MSGVEKWTCSCSHKEIGTIYFLRGAWGAIYGTSLLGVTSCFTDSNSSPKRKIWTEGGIINKRPTLQIREPISLDGSNLEQEVPPHVPYDEFFNLVNKKFYFDPPQTEPLDLSNNIYTWLRSPTDSCEQSVRVCIDIEGGRVCTVPTPANHLPNGSTRGTHHTGATSANDTGTPHYLSNGSTRGTHHTGATSANDPWTLNYSLPKQVTLKKREVSAEEDLSIPNYLPNGSTRGTHHTRATSANDIWTPESFEVSHLRRIMPSDGFVVSPLRMLSWVYPLLIFGKVVSSYSIIIPTLLSVAYITLLERKILASRQFRFGPNKVSWVGILQPIADALKLFSKQVSSPFSGNLFIYVISPILSMLLMLIIWGLAPLIAGSLSFKYSSVIILVILRFGVYPLLLSGWSSNRKYAMLGSLRGVAQTISYEISLALILLTIILYTSSYEIEEIIKFSKLLSLLFVMPFISLLWVISCIAETNRTPFDFSEGESELVSGFNIEYGSGLFALIFIAEYGRIFFLSIISASILMRLMSRSIMTHTIIITLVFLWIWSRTTLPRYRYDLLMALAWKAFLPFSLGILELSLSLITT